MKKIIILLVCLTGFSSGLFASPIAGVDFTSFSTYSTDGPWTLGYQFSTNEDISVSHLGAFDFNTDGFVSSKSVGLWDAAGNLLASTVVSSSDSLTGFFRYSSIAPTLLAAGSTFYVGANGFGAGGDVYALTASGLTTASQINYLQSAYNSGGSLSIPTSLGNNSGYYGANFLFESAPVPEPALFSLLALGLVTVRLGRKKKSA